MTCTFCMISERYFRHAIMFCYVFFKKEIKDNGFGKFHGTGKFLNLYLHVSFIMLMITKKIFVNCVELIWCLTTYMHNSQTTCTTTNYSWRGFCNLSLVGVGSCSSVFFCNYEIYNQPIQYPTPHPVTFISAHMLWKQITCLIYFQNDKKNLLFKCTDGRNQN